MRSAPVRSTPVTRAPVKLVRSRHAKVSPPKVGLDPFARGAFVGLTGALMEGVAFSLRDRLDLMREAGLSAEEVRVTGGGARHRLWRQRQADVYGLEVRRPIPEPGFPVSGFLPGGNGAQGRADG